MNRTIPAIFDAGVFRPLEPVVLAEGTRVEVQVSASLPQPIAMQELSPEQLARQQAAVAAFIARMESLPSEGPNDGFSGRDHDKILYGKP